MLLGCGLARGGCAAVVPPPRAPQLCADSRRVSLATSPCGFVGNGVSLSPAPSPCSGCCRGFQLGMRAGEVGGTDNSTSGKRSYRQSSSVSVPADRAQVCHLLICLLTFECKPTQIPGKWLHPFLFILKQTNKSNGSFLGTIGVSSLG